MHLMGCVPSQIQTPKGMGTRRRDLWGDKYGSLGLNQSKSFHFLSQWLFMRGDMRYSLTNDIQKEVCCEEGLQEKLTCPQGTPEEKQALCFPLDRLGLHMMAGVLAATSCPAADSVDIRNHPISGSRSLGMAKYFLTALANFTQSGYLLLKAFHLIHCYHLFILLMRINQSR